MLAMTPPVLSAVARDALRELQVARMSPTWQPARRDWNLAHFISRFGTLLSSVHPRRFPDAAASAQRCLVLIRLMSAPGATAEQDALWLKAREELGCHFKPGWPESVTMLATALGAALEEPIMRRICAVDHLAELLLATAKCWPTSPVPPPLFLSTREVA
jgi:hypothetical protein